MKCSQDTKWWKKDCTQLLSSWMMSNWHEKNFMKNILIQGSTKTSSVNDVHDCQDTETFNDNIIF